MKAAANRVRRVAALALVGALGLAAAGAATEVRFFRLGSQGAFAAGSFEGVSVDDLGRLALADGVERVAGLEEPFLFAAAAHPEGWVVGTGNSGRVLLVTRTGEARLLFEAPEPEIFAIWAAADGTVYAGSSPQGKVYRIADGEGEVYFEPGEAYIWDLAPTAGGDLLVATGTTGRLYRVTGRGQGEILFDSEDTHIRSLAPLPDGQVVAGTAGEGLILRIGPTGEARTLYDAAQPEVVDLALDDEGDLYAALLASEASLVDLSTPKATESEESSSGAAAGGAASVALSAEGEVAGSRPPAYQGPRSEVVRVTRRGRVESLWSFDDETVYALRWQRDRLWVGTGLEGNLYVFRDRRMVLEKDVDERQVVALLDDRPGPAFATANATALYRLSGSRERQGTYTSPALDAGQIAEFGTLRWEGSLPDSTGVAFSVRSGISAQPDRTWAPWTPAAEGREVALADLPAGRYLQWRAELTGDGDSPQLSQVTVSYRQLNLPPRIDSFTALGPGEIVVPANFNPGKQVFEPAHPTRDGIFTTLEPPDAAAGDGGKNLWKRGFRTLRWAAGDPNGDSLTAQLEFRQEGAGESWLPMAEELERSFYSFDATVLPDGIYRFRITVADDGGGDRPLSLSAQQVSEPVRIDHTAPRLIDVRRVGDGLRIEVEDASSPLREAVVSVDAGEWERARPADGLVDSRKEVLRVEGVEEPRLLLLRLTDAAFNVITIDLLRELR